MENRKLYTACQGKIPLRPLRAIAGAIEERRQNRRESEDNRMSLFKKSGEGFLAKLFKHKQVEELAEEQEGKVKVCKLNVDDASGIAARYGISSIPTLILFRNGEIAASSLGFKPKAEIEELLK